MGVRYARNPTLILVSLDEARIDAGLVREIRQLVDRAKPIVVLADLSNERNVASAIKQEQAVSSRNRSIWTIVLPQ